MTCGGPDVLLRITGRAGPLGVVSGSDEVADTHASGYDSELRALDVVFRRACDVQVGDRVLDIGCGTGQTTRAAAVAAGDGSALGVDISLPAIERAREAAAADGVRNVVFERADAQIHPFPPSGFDVAISRFGTMFFDDAVVAFTNVARALAPAGRLVMMVWQSGGRNEWDEAVRRSLDGPAEAESAAFSLADPTETEAILRAAGFIDVGFVEVDEPVYYGPDVPAAMAWVRSFTTTTELLGRLDAEGAQRGLARLQQVVSAHLRDDGVWFGSRAWVVTARRE